MLTKILKHPPIAISMIPPVIVREDWKLTNPNIPSTFVMTCKKIMKISTTTPIANSKLLSMTEIPQKLFPIEDTYNRK